MADQPHIVLYVSDSLRADHLSCYGYDRETTPQVDRLAADGVRFDHAFAQAYKTVESSVSIVTGLYPPAHGARTTYDAIPADAPSLAETLAAAGYRTAGFSSLVQLSERRGFDRGFETFQELFRTHRIDDGVTDWAAVCTDRAIEWLEGHRGGERPLFLFVWSNGTHDPYAPRAGEFADPDHPVDGSLKSLRAADADDAARVRDLYDDTIRHADAEFGRLCSYLRESGLYDETAIVFTADHGELLSEHGRLQHAYRPVKRLVSRLAPAVVRSKTLFDPGAFVGHLGVLPYEELLHVPMIIKPPGRTHAGERRSGLVETVDLAPTIADLAGASVGSRAPPRDSQGPSFDTQGTSLRPLLAADRAFKEYVYSDTAISRGLTQSRSVRSADHKLVRTDWAPARLRSREALEATNAALSVLQKTTGPTELCFALPDEDRPIGDEEPAIRRKLADELDEWLLDSERRSLESSVTELDDETVSQLQELGYMS
ncbi:MAG: sulfatase [Halohasta sp.]